MGPKKNVMGKEVVLNFGLLEGTEILKKCSKHFTELRSSLSPFVTCIIPQSAIPFSSLYAKSCKIFQYRVKGKILTVFSIYVKSQTDIRGTTSVKASVTVVVVLLKMKISNNIAENML